MNYTSDQMKIIFEKYTKFVDDLDFNYNDNIKTLLYIIIPGFVLKYGIENEDIILRTFKNVTVLINPKKDEHVQAYFQSIPRNNDGKIEIVKYIVLQNYESDNLVNLMDNLVHEYNHALNSENNPTKEFGKIVQLRTGISYFDYDKETMNFLKRDNNYILEEILNTKETEDIIDIIHTFNKYDFLSPKIKTLLYFLDNHAPDKFSSDAYKLEILFTKNLISNKTFMSTLSKLRVKGDIDIVNDWFDDIIGIKGSFKTMVDIICEVAVLKKENSKWNFVNKKRDKKIKELYQKCQKIVDSFNNNCNFK